MSSTPITVADLVAEAKGRIREVSADEVRAMRERGDALVLLDVREPDETAMNRIPGAVAIPRGLLEWRAEAEVPRDATVVLYCAAGGRSVLAADTLHRMGYTDVASMRGGIQGWGDVGGELEG